MPGEILYDRMRTAVSGEDADGGVVFNKTLLELARHYAGPFAPDRVARYHQDGAHAGPR